MAAIEIRENGDDVRVCELTRDHNILGRHPECDVCLDRRNVSRQHCRIICEGGLWYVEDLNSLNGTFVNGRRIAGRHPLQDRDLLHIYKLSATFYSGAAPVRAQVLTTPREPVLHLPPTPPAAESQGPREPNILHSYRVEPATLPLTLSEKKLPGVFHLLATMNDPAEPEVLLPRLLDALFLVFPQARRGHLVFSEGKDPARVLFANKSRSEEAAGETMLGPIRNNIAEQVLKEGIAVLGVDYADEAKEEAQDSIFEVVNRAAMYVPLLRMEGDPLGVAYLDTTEPERRFQADDLEVFAALALVAGQIIDYSRQHARRHTMQREVNKANEAHEA
ncbi:FHA domain-containing protein [Lignipirellula cremea]|uniref:Glycogen accumulation regulator GarA n=1 Tax=Lignipirellula cremea TaxID=2528010 RepID=A0A518DQ31_9BACT|nr:FHA domain-containing protein [Lignipirellula cremea]QDU93933.1 Glycogen accumulation regulator GarA [Lignipirellula cremea]